jgi:hypothetical protein
MYSSLLISLIFLLGTACKKEEKNNSTSNTTITVNQPVSGPQHRGVSFVSPSNPVGADSFDPISQLNANWTAIIPFGFIRTGHSNVEYNIPWQWWGERDEGVIELTEFAHSKDIKIMIKPQIWLMGGAFTGDFSLSTESEWLDLENTYYGYIMHFADLADSLGAEAFCIGTEFKAFIANRPAFWGRLIDSVRAHYPGEVTYAGNWDSYQGFPHWSKLDFIGIDAYFPVGEGETPSVEECVQAWQPHYNSIKSHQQQIGKPVVFTEYGYRSISYCGKQPWDSSGGGTLNMDAQNNTYKALYKVFWNESWFDGGFLWKWYPNHSNSGGLSNDRFTPQNKPAEDIIRAQYGN